MKSLFAQIREVAHNPKSTVLMLGETGTGKEFVARVLHHNGSRASSSLYRRKLYGNPSRSL